VKNTLEYNAEAYFFTHLLTNFGEYKMWRTFKLRGEVQDVFISRRLNRNGKQFGFIRFQGNDGVCLTSRVVVLRIMKI